ncbi:beta-ketoacyl-ACP synthase III [Pontibacter sp. G13]|uniref:beta-ketoacyl-ACP synthase III n=1 Tax=Pontibacter sp. G13 TaxID=3074898 RepID=UPI002889298C|nr:beta-ketoacyl-ACP synthase III [Pontibacter sp. G13]WNJ16466.1 beta-ketoacyl-ACP synthase III [Pontibacter sp. G13]
MEIRAAITAVGGYVPEKRLTNFDLEKMVDTSDEWIRDRTGIEERRILEPEKATSDMAVEAIKDLLAKTDYTPEDIDLIICSTVSPDHVYPATANIISDKIGAKNAWGFDMNAACSGFLYALRTGSQFIESGMHKRVLVVGADTMSIRVDYEDRNTCIIFGDGAGCVLLEPNAEGLGIVDSQFYVEGAGRQYLFQKAGGSAVPTTIDTVQNKEHFIHQDGRTVFKFAVKGMADTTEEVMKRNNLTADDIAYLVPHQANKRIIDATANRAGLPSEKVMVNIQRYGNTTNGTIPLCLWEWEKKLKAGDNLLLSAFGGGFAWGCIYLKWSY